MNDMTVKTDTAILMEQVLIKGDLSRLTPQERATYYAAVCRSVGLNPLTKPFEFIELNRKLVLYALKAATDQLRTIHKVSVTELTESDWEGVYIVTAKVQNGDGRTDSAKGAVCIQGLRGEALANAIMKAETKAKRRATLSICGLGMLDEAEVEDIPAQAKTAEAAVETFNEVATEAKALPKKDTKDTYRHLQEEIDTAQSRERLRQWRETATARIATLKKDWRDLLFERYKEQMAFLKNQEPPIHDKDGVIWDEDGEYPASELRESLHRSSAALDARREARGATKPDEDGLGIPTFLQRAKAPAAPSEPDYGPNAWIELMQAAE